MLAASCYGLLVPFFVYILRCADGSLYIGHTDDLERRLAEHVTGERGGYTAVRHPVEPLFVEEAPTRDEAIVRERQLKSWTRAKKEALIAGDWARLSTLARGTDRH
jgi:predicted GIY-YIG superfamily endonuclease